MIKTPIILMAVFLLIIIPTYSEQTSTLPSDALLDQIQKELSAIKTLETDFTQTRHLAIFEDELISEGKLYYVLPDQMRWEIRKPYRSTLIFNQNKMVKYEIRDGQPRKMELAGAALFSEIMNQMMHIMKGNFQAIEKQYAINAERGENVTVILMPRSPKLATLITSFVFTIHPKTYRVKKLDIKEGSKDDIEIVFQNEKENRTLDPSLFSMENPSGFETGLSK